MNILVLNGSPKGNKSNTLKLTNAFIEGITEKINANVEIIDVYKLKVHECLGCFNCWSKTPGKCIISDDMGEIINKIVKADILIWSFPLYYFNIPSRLKLIVDRMLPMSLPFMNKSSESGGHPSRYNMKAQRVVTISTCGFYTPKGNYEAVDLQFDKIYGKNNYTKIYCGEGELFRVPELKNKTDEYLEYVKEAGSEFIHGKISPKTRENLNQLLYPREIFEEMADASWGIEQNEDNKKPSSKAHILLKQMAALYNTSSWKNNDIILEFDFTDLDEIYQIVLKKDGTEVLTENFKPYTTKIETPFSIWEKISRGEINGQEALMKHSYSVNGDFNLMLNWDDYFNTGKKDNTKSEKTEIQKEPNMLIMLIPWITIWIGLSINSFWGAIIGLAVISLIPFSFIKYQATIFDYLTVFLVSVICLLSILNFPIDILVSLSYLIFGLMWTLTIFMKIPLTAFYSMKDYGMNSALKNPLFIQTNRILTACWGILYILTAIWTYGLLNTSLSSYTGLINSILPFILLAFTKWFQKWYPKHFATLSNK